VSAPALAQENASLKNDPGEMRAKLWLRWKRLPPRWSSRPLTELQKENRSANQH